MKLLLAILFIFIFARPQTVSAEVSVDISNKVNVNTQSSTKSTTDVTLENNGQVKTFHAEGDQDVNWQSEDGKSSVKINTDTDTSLSVSPNPFLQSSPSPSPSPSGNENTGLEVQKKEDRGIIGDIMEEANRLDSILRDFFKQLFKL